MKVIFYSIQDYDRDSFLKYKKDFKMIFVKTRLDESTAVFAFGCDVVVGCPYDVINAAVIDELLEAGVKLLAMRSAGYNNVDVEYARGKLPIVRVPDYSPYSVAEFAITLMLTVIRNPHKAYIRTRAHDFSINQLAGFEIHGKTVGVIGEGKIGKCTIDICKGMGMKILVNTPHPRGLPDVEYVGLDELFERSDVIQLHCPLTKDNRHMINDETIAKMKPGVAIINTARGGLIDTQALIRGLLSRKIRGVGLDVYENESGTFTVDYTEDILADEQLQILLGFPNVVITAHQAYFTNESMDNICDTTIRNIKEFFETGTCVNMIK
jgi:D-lactate dehydrogenase